MTSKHWAAIGLFLAGAAATMSSLHSWSEATSPAFVAGLLAQAGSAIVALFADKPGSRS